MKIEIDFSKPDQLRVLKRDLEAALATVESALKAIGPTPDPLQTPLFVASHQAQVRETIDATDSSSATVVRAISKVEDLFHNTGNEFTSKEWIVRGKASNIPESQVRNYIKELEGVGRITLIQKGGGRRPSRYRKN